MAMTILLVGIFKSLKRYVFNLTVISALIALLLSLFAYRDDSLFIFNASLIKSNVTEFFKIICYVVFLIQILISQKYLRDKKLISGEFYSLLLFALIGCLIIISANNLITLFLGIELSSLSLYSLIALNRTSLISGEAAIKYFVLSIIASALILFGFSYLYRGRKNRKAYFISHNNKLEIFWTAIPTVVLSVLIVYGLIVWGNVTDVNNAKGGIQMEVYAKQFGWTIRYAGEDNKLGDGHVRFYAPTNPLGVVTENMYKLQSAELDSKISSDKEKLLVEKKILD